MRRAVATKRKPSAAPPTSAPSAPSDGADLGPVVGVNIRRLRTGRSWSLEALAHASGVSRAMLGQIELGQSVPTINVLWKIAKAFDVPFSTLIATREPKHVTVLPAKQSRRLLSHDGTFQSRALFPADDARRVELYELTFLPGCVEEAVAHPAGTVENLVVHEGQLAIELRGAAHALGPGDAIQFDADVPHVYRNTGKKPALAYLAMSYAVAS